MPGRSLTACRTCASRSPGRAELRRPGAFLAARLRVVRAVELGDVAPELEVFAWLAAFLLRAPRVRLVAALRPDVGLLFALAYPRLAAERPRAVVDLRAAAAAAAAKAPEPDAPGA